MFELINKNGYLEMTGFTSYEECVIYLNYRSEEFCNSVNINECTDEDSIATWKAEVAARNEP